MKWKISVLICCVIHYSAHTSQNMAIKKKSSSNYEMTREKIAGKQRLLEEINNTQLLPFNIWNMVADYLTRFVPNAPLSSSKPTSLLSVQAIDPYVACGDTEGDIHLWNINNGTLIHQFRGHSGSTFPLTALLHERFASGSSDKTVRIWDIPTRSCIRILKGHCSGIIGLEAHNNLLAAFTEKNRARLWNIDTGACLREFYNSNALCLSAVFTLEGLLVGDRQGNIIQWTIDGLKGSIKPKPTAYIESRCKECICTLKRSPQGKLALSYVDLTGGASLIEIWDSNKIYLQTIHIDVDKDDCANHMLLALAHQDTMQAVMSRMNAMTWLSENELALLDTTERLLVCSTVTGKILQKFKFFKESAPTGLAYIGDRLVVSTSDGKIIVCDRKIDIAITRKKT